jgi:UDP-N-acetylglucosamine:LPS N-acetylglucosamine transferase
VKLRDPQRATRTKVIAISSGGGHWVQLLRLRPAFEGCQVTFVTTRLSYRCDVGSAPFRVVPDSNNSQKFRLLLTAMALLWVVVCERPDVVISTGAAPGFFGIWFGRLMGARTIWLDSVANAEVLSLAGRKIGPSADLWLTQWPHLAKKNGPLFHGSVI